MNRTERFRLERIFWDCVRLERETRLSEYDAAQGDLCIRLLRKRRQLFSLKRITRIRCRGCGRVYNNRKNCVFCDCKDMEFLRE
ncbi:hypothetical protein KY366_02685 [Candidatus Woesearchaeota archaeon]|nr:hypothetical protein [Candidatus Woesearchaeota archaeon]